MDNNNRYTKSLAIVEKAGKRGITWEELANKLKTHHGTASGALSTLHKEGMLSRLVDKRGGNSIYVMTRFVSGRKTSSYRQNRARRMLTELMDNMDKQLKKGNIDACKRLIAETRAQLDD